MNTELNTEDVHCQVTAGTVVALVGIDNTLTLRSTRPWHDRRLPA